MARATTIFDADDSRLNQAWKRMGQQINDAKKKFGFLGGAAKAGFAGGAAAGAILGAGIKSAVDEGGKLYDLSKQTGIAVEQLAILDREAKNAGKDIGAVAGAVNKMQKALGDGSADTLLADLVGDVAAFKQLDAVTQFQMLGKAINALPPQVDRTGAAMKLFGKSGAEFLSMFSSGGFGDAAQQVGTQAALLGQNAALFDDASDKLALSGTKVQGFFVGVADQVVPVLKPMLDQFAALDGAAIGQEIGQGVAMGLQMLQDGTLADSLGLAISIAIGRAVNFLASGVLGASAMFGQSMIDGAKITGSTLRAALNPANLLAALRGEGPLSADAISAQLQAAGARAQTMGRAGFQMGANLVDVSSMEEMLAGNMQRAITRAAEARDTALAAVPTIAPTNGISTLAADSVSKSSANVSALQKVGGGFTGIGGDPLVEANRIARDSLSVEQQILNAILGQSNRITGGFATYG